MSIQSAIYTAKIENELVELMLKTNVANVYMDDGTTTLAAKLAEMITAINLRAKSTDVTAEISAAISELINGAPETYDTLKEIADYIANNETVVEALDAAIGNKVDKEAGKGLSTNDYTTAEKNKLAGIATNANNYTLPTATSSTLGGVKVGTNLSISNGVLSSKDTTYSPATSTANGLMSATDKAKIDALGTLASKSAVTETDLDSNLKEKVNAAAEGNHSHSNKAVLDGITAAKVTAWDGKPDVYIQSTTPSSMKNNDIFIRIV